MNPVPSASQHLPYCTAAATAVLIDGDKGVRPCDAYEGVGIHRPDTPSIDILGERTIAEVIRGPAWQEVRRQLEAQEIPPGCAKCVERERISGHSQRLMFQARRPPNWRSGLTYFELNSSNLCNLQCRHCCTLLSSRWVAHERKQGRRCGAVVPPDAALLRRSLEGLDLTHLDSVSLKGGEPMLNGDVAVLLRHLEAIGVLAKVTIWMVTNATVVNPEILQLMAQARRCFVCVSVDGIGAVQTYIRHGASEIERVEAAIEQYLALPNITLDRNTSVMVHNVFHLDRIDAWWNGLAARHPGRLRPCAYSLFVLWPEHLAVQCLQDRTRRALRNRYQALDPVLYAPVVRVLDQPFAGVRRHDEFVRRTQELDRELGTDVLEAVPELAEEMVLLGPQ